MALSPKKANNFDTAINALLAAELGKGFDKTTNTMDNNVRIIVHSANFRTDGFAEVTVTLTNKSESESKTFDGISFWLYDGDNRLYDIYPSFSFPGNMAAQYRSGDLFPPKATILGSVIYDTRNFKAAKIFFVPTGGGILEGSEITINR